MLRVKHYGTDIIHYWTYLGNLDIKRGGLLLETPISRKHLARLHGHVWWQNPKASVFLSGLKGHWRWHAWDPGAGSWSENWKIQLPHVEIILAQVSSDFHVTKANDHRSSVHFSSDLSAVLNSTDCSPQMQHFITVLLHFLDFLLPHLPLLSLLWQVLLVFLISEIWDAPGTNLWALSPSYTHSLRSSQLGLRI